MDAISQVQSLDVLSNVTLSPSCGAEVPPDQFAEFDARLSAPSPVHVRSAALTEKVSRSIVNLY